MSTTPLDLPDHVHDQADLTRAWRALMGPLGFAGASLWLMMIDPDGRLVPQLTQIEDADTPPDAEQAAGLAAMLGDLLADVQPGGRWAILRSRPGAGGPTEVDLAWARGLLAACRAADVALATLHLATDVELRPLSGDDLLA